MDDPEFMSLLDQPVNGNHAEQLALEQRISFYTVDMLAKEEAKERVRITRRSGRSPDDALTPFDLGDLMSMGAPQPEILTNTLLYRGGLHSIAGPPDSGKTTAALWWAAKLLREGQNVMFLDEEGGGDVVSEKLIALGVNPMETSLLTYIPFPGRTWTDEDVDALCRLTEKVTPAMVLFDSSAAFMARAGLDENQASDVTGWWSRVATPLARDFGAAVLVIDHDTKSSEGSRYARGSGAKLAAIDCQFKVEIVKPFTRQQAGILKFRVSKDRRGWLDRDWRVMVRSVDGRMEMHFTLADEDGNKIPDMPPARAKIYEQLTDIPQTWQEINEGINRTHSHYLRRETLSTELNELLRTGLISRCGGGMGAGDFAKWKLPD